MATKNFRSTVLEPTSEFAHGDKLRFTALATVGEVLKGSFSETTIGEDGVYSVDLQYGKHRIDYKPYEGVWRHFADVEVNADTLATTLQDLALASVPVTDETVLVLQGILSDAEAAKAAAEISEAAAETALASIDSTVAEVEAGYPSLLAIEYPKLISKTFYVNAATGDDSNDGLTAGTAVKTIAALQSRVTVGGRHTISLDYGKHDVESVNFLNCLVILVGKSNVSSLISAGTAVTTSNASIVSIKKSLAMSNRINGAEIQLRNVHITNDLAEGGYTANPLEASYNSCIICDELSAYSSGYESRDHNVALYSKSGGNALVKFLCDGFGITGNVNYLIKGNTTVKTSIAMSTYGIVNRATNDAGSATSLVYSAGFLQVIGG